MHTSVWEFVFLVIGGFAAGIINSLAGNGSAITLPLLIFTGLDANTANATNRVGVLMQTLTSTVSLRRTQRTQMLIKLSMWYYVPTILGSIVGALLAVYIHPEAMLLFIGIIMVFLLVTMLRKPQRWLINTDPNKARKTLSQWLVFFAIGFYGGFIQMGIGILILSSLVLIAQYSMRDANIIKILVSLVMIVPAFLVYAFSGTILWAEGLVLAVGTSSGAWVGTRYLLYHRSASRIIRYVLIVVISFAIIKTFYMLWLKYF